MNSRTIFVAGAVFLSAALATNYFQEQEPTGPRAIAIPATLADDEVLTWNCEIPEYQPESIMLTCADGGWMVHTITWSKWAKSGAEGTGIFREKLCEPSCAEGEIANEKVKVTLSDLTERKGKYYLRTLDISTASGKDFMSGRAGELKWDVMEFIEMMRKGN
jgi:hypothetical protein